MELLVTAIVAVVLTAVVIAVARAGASRHQEDLNEHGATTTRSERGTGTPARPGQPRSDRPAGPDAEAMGVAEAGEPSVDPTAERRS